MSVAGSVPAWRPRPHLVPLAAAASAFVGMHACYLISASLGYVDWCIPYLEGCTTISRAGRYPPAVHVYRAFMIPAALLMAAFWISTPGWLLSLGETSRGLATSIGGLGAAAGAGLAISAVLLGTADADWRAVRRVAVAVFFVLTFACHCLLTWRATRLVGARAPGRLRLAVSVLRVLCGLEVAIALISLAGSLLLVERDHFDDLLEWHFVLIVLLHFAVAAGALRQTAVARSAGLG